MSQYEGFYVFAGVGIAMMLNSSYIRYKEKQEDERKAELLRGVTEKPVYNENMNRRNSIGGTKRKK